MQSAISYETPFRLISSRGKNHIATKNSKNVAKIDIGISERERARIAEGLPALLADSYTLYLMTHNFHWKVTGPMFTRLHALFLEQDIEQWDALGQIAERIRALGYPSPGTCAEFAKRTSIKEVAGVPKAMDVVRHLVNAQESTVRTGCALFDLVEKANDQPTADLLTQRLDMHEKVAWMLRNILEEYSLQVVN